MNRRDLFWKAVNAGNYKHAMTFIKEVFASKEPYLVENVHSNSGVILLGIATFGPGRADAGVDWVNDSGVPGALNWRLAGSESNSTPSPKGDKDVH